MNCKGSNFLSLQLLQGISFLMQAKCFVGVGLVVVGSMLSAHSVLVFFSLPQQAWRHCSSKLAIKRLLGRLISHWGLWAAWHSLIGISPSPKPLCWQGQTMTREMAGIENMSWKHLFQLQTLCMQNDTDTSMSSAYLLQLGRHWTLVIWTVLGTAQLSGCLSESCCAEWQGTSALVMYRYYTCLAVPGYYASHPEAAVPLQRICRSCEITWKLGFYHLVREGRMTLICFTMTVDTTEGRDVVQRDLTSRSGPTRTSGDSIVLHLGQSNPRCKYRLGEGVIDTDVWSYCLRMNFSGSKVISLLHVLKVLSKYDNSVAGHQS